jgi:hypothetical protein
MAECGFLGAYITAAERNKMSLKIAICFALVNSIPLSSIERNIKTFFHSKRQRNHIFSRARNRVMIGHPKTFKEDAHGKENYPGRTATQRATLAGTFICPEKKRLEPRCLLQGT